MASKSQSYKALLLGAKLVLAIGILSYLFLRIQRESGFQRLLTEPKTWSALLLAQLMVLLAFCCSFVRWFLLVRGLNLRFQLRDAFRLGSLGYMLNQVSPGSVGGDLLKAVFIAHEQPGRRTEAIATVFVDRVVGLYAMLLIASLALVAAGDAIVSTSLLNSLRTIVWSATICGTLGVAFALSPLATGSHARALADRLPLIGPTVTRLIEAADVYRSRRIYLLAGFVLALCTHCLLISAFWFISRGLPVDGPSFAQNASIVPVGLVAGALPLTPGGLGALEGGMEFLYSSIGAGKGDGTLVALAYRAMTYVFAGAGAFYYFSARRNVEQLMHEAEELAEEENLSESS